MGDPVEKGKEGMNAVGERDWGVGFRTGTRM